MDFYPSELLLFLYQAPPSNKEAGHYQGDFFWIQYTYLTHARKLYKKVQTIIKRQKKTIKDILKLDECYNFHKEIS